MIELPPALIPIRDATSGTPFEGKVWLVGGAVRDALSGREVSDDLDLVVEGDALDLVWRLFEGGIGEARPTLYASFGTALLPVPGAKVEFVTARRESYRGESRKPTVEPATLLEDARRRDFTVNALYVNVHSGELRDDVGGLGDLRSRILRTPLDPVETFRDDPLRMLRAIRFRAKLGFEYAAGVEAAIEAEADRIAILSVERIQEELVKMLLLPNAGAALEDLRRLGLLVRFAPELAAMSGVEQGRYHHLDVWLHTLVVVDNTPADNLVLRLGALFHDIGKPSTRTTDVEGNTRFFGHEIVGAEMARDVLGRLRFSHEIAARVIRLVRNHMRLGSAPKFSASAARRLIRDLADDLDLLLDLVEADQRGLKSGVSTFELAPIREAIDRVLQETPADTLRSPLDGIEIMTLLGIEGGPQVGTAKAWLTERVIEGELAPDDREGATAMLLAEFGPRDAP
ncbi:MAG TPA: HDIG domain-containing protein [Fimbriimonadaceae bacterium]|nr:HDIG domain-containing protein [Fimbriimonadaceae bacterium]